MGSLMRWIAMSAAALSLAGGAWAAESAQDATLVSGVARHLADAGGVRAQFKQTRTLAAMKEPLVSTGSIVFVRERGVIWRVETPYKATYAITDAGMREIGVNGKPRASRANDARGAAQVSRMMRAMLGGDLSGLYSQFDVKAHGTPSNWRIELTPNQPQLAQSVRRLDMNGGDFLQGLRIVLANGDATQIDFTGSAPAGELSPAERAQFGAP
ncbi:MULTISPECIES: outer membrane lipoprotein carrier protein LolA [unclassified Caballeronia]|uniref:LolA family protein n=1 Tax=unclassified Caballeronia TaxID=2646786 RepID=UPI002856B093|nr:MULTISPECIES: outer membrane lipoprotein carrier protein LolA [unclassified Caballeronia]MDR5754208.1 outer membrane lipoprotein carrier protein LolA [Caballeronia sp. LZ024]MDR5840586.1 outer membrane lipoprotein carrier protein LolA [Caballeronia sp. LZ031]